jgi:murein DD-endopeptidase MepM/ murein hydrolase activator NlpD
MKERITTVFFVSNDSAETQFYTVPTKHVEKFKSYVKISAAVLGIIIVSLISLIVFLKVANNEISKLNNNVLSLKNDLKLLDSLEIKKKVGNIDNNINDINKYLIERGVFNTENAGGPEDNSNPDIRVYEFYFNKTEQILKAIKNVPIGNPIIGEFKSPFGYRSNPFGGRGSEFHKGLDIKGNIGDPVKCTASGTVIMAEYDGGYGKAVIIDHHNGLTSKFGHMSGFNVKAGDEVNAGDVIGFVGSTGRSTGPHLHYEIKYKEDFINPQNFLNIK